MIDVTKEAITAAMTAIGLEHIDVGEGGNRWWATGRPGRLIIQPRALERAIARTFPQLKHGARGRNGGFRVSRKQRELHLTIWKPPVIPVTETARRVWTSIDRLIGSDRLVQ